MQDPLYTDAHAEALLQWFALQQRQLPWRSPPGAPPTPAYAVLVSELMLQQPRVVTVLDYFRRWMQRWPTIEDLASASLDDVLAQWTGLGYYNRARNLHRTAVEVTTQFSGVIPSDEGSLASLPGLGPYTVGAIRSIAFGQPAALVDGNVARVLARWHAVAADPQSTPGKSLIWQHAERWLHSPSARQSPSAWNQALMELGATICSPRNPDCSQCPVSAGCQAFALGTPTDFPPPRQRKTSPIVAAQHALVVVDSADAQVADPGQMLVLLGQRPSSGRWAGLWEPPGTEGPDGAERLQNWLSDQALANAQEQPMITHILTHRRYEVRPLLVRTEDRPVDLGALGYVAQRWMPLAQAMSKTSGLSRLAQRLLEGLYAAPALEVGGPQAKRQVDLFLQNGPPSGHTAS